MDFLGLLNEYTDSQGATVRVREPAGVKLKPVEKASSKFTVREAEPEQLMLNLEDFAAVKTEEPPKEKKETPTIVGAKKKISLASPLNDRKHEFYQSILPYYDKYSRDMLNDFYEYWTELDKRGKRMRFEMQKTWETGKRLSLWSSRSFH